MLHQCRVWLAIADHYEPLWHAASEESGIQRVRRWAERWPTIRGLCTHGFPPQMLERMPRPLEELLGRDQLMIEVLYPIYWGRTHPFPFSDLRPALRALHRRVGSQRLVWGSDMPNVERNCTYRQSLEYLPRIEVHFRVNRAGRRQLLPIAMCAFRKYDHRRIQ